MTVQTLIESGALEAYLAGLGDPPSRQEIERVLLQEPKARTELMAIEEALERYSLSQCVPPPPGLKAQIMAAIQAERRAMPLRGYHTVPSWLWALLAILAVAIVLLVGSYRAQSQAQQVLETQIAALRQDLDGCQKQQSQTSPIYALLHDTHTKRLSVASPNLADTGVLFYNDSLSVALFDIKRLPPTDEGYYQCWGLTGNDVIPLGMVRLDAPLTVLKYQKGIKEFAISLEPVPEGNAKPTKVLVKLRV